ncbi:MAG: phosphoglycerate dehydrogenase [Candidatus Omnitrophota bacterium]|jgi:D-3-phosphoglycerate dehydrogenase
MSSKAKFKVLVSDPLGKAGMAELRADASLEVDELPGLAPEKLKEIMPQYDAVIVRSGTKLTKELIEAGTKLKVVGRAGVGVDNVDLETATKHGVIVMNTPEGNTISTAEHTVTMLLALARKIPQAHASLSGGEWKRTKFLGTEVNGKVLGVVGFGRIGREVAKRAAAFNMRVVAYDPFIPAETIKQYGVESADVKSLLKIADFITFHTPLTPETKHLLNEKTFALCKKGVRIVNCARGGIVEEKALIEAIKSGQVAGAALDVFEKEPPAPDYPLLKMPEVICTPHLGAATEEAQENVAVDVARQVMDALHERAIKNAVNLPNLDPETYRVVKPWITLAEKMGSLYSQLFTGTVKKVTIRYGGEVSRYNLKPLTIAVLKGLLAPVCGPTVNFVNAPAMAEERGIAVEESASTAKENFSNYIEIEVEPDGAAKEATHRIMGTLFADHRPRVVRIDQFLIDVEPVSWILFIHNEDQPGVVGTVGTLLGNNGINIAEMSLGRLTKGKKMMAMTVINTDNEVPEKVLAKIREFSPILDVKIVKL